MAEEHRPIQESAPALVADEGETLVAGWEEHLPPDDTVQRHALLANAARVIHDAHTGGFPWARDEHLTLGVTAPSGMFANWALAMQPVVDGAGVVGAVHSFFGEHFALLVSPWPTPDLRSVGCAPIGHPPLMVRPPGGVAPPSPELDVREVHDPQGIAWFEEALIDGYPAEGVEDRSLGCLVTPSMLEPSSWGRNRRFVGLVDGRPVACAVGFLHAGAVEVDYVATLPDVRGRGYGAALTWAATMADPTAPAMLIASDEGRPVYERMGYLAVERWTLWAVPPA